MKKVSVLLPILVFVLLLSGCSENVANNEQNLIEKDEDYQNKRNYSIEKDGGFELYFSENSCCGRCWNLEELKYISMEGVRTVKANYTDGGSSTYAYVFKGHTKGTDTLRTDYYAMSDSCKLKSKRAEYFVVTVN